MTPTETTPTQPQDVLEAILALVESIDRNVEEILDHLADHVAETRLSGWRDDATLDDAECE